MSEFQVGDRVKHSMTPGIYGTVQSLSGTPTVGEGGIYGEIITVLFDETPAFTPSSDNGPVRCSSAFMTKVDERWEKSYTKQVVDNLERSWEGVPRNNPEADILPREERAAVELLKQYHRDLHLPYQQRDEARAELDAVTAQLNSLAADAVKLFDQRNEARVQLDGMRSEMGFWHRAALRQSQRGIEMMTEIVNLRKSRDMWQKLAIRRGEKINAISDVLDPPVPEVTL